MLLETSELIYGFVTISSTWVAVTKLHASRPRDDFTPPPSPHTPPQYSVASFATLRVALSSLAWAPLFVLQRCAIFLCPWSMQFGDGYYKASQSLSKFGPSTSKQYRTNADKVREFFSNRNRTRAYKFTVHCHNTLWKSITYIYIYIKLSRYMPRRHKGGRRYSSYSYLTSALDGGEWSASRPGALYPFRYPLDKRLGRPQSRSGRRG
jgi:hypothetical protein